MLRALAVLLFFVAIALEASQGQAANALSRRGGGTCVPAALCLLMRIPWEGGSQYWGGFSPTHAAGWDNPSFFPVAAWLNIGSSGENITAPSDVDTFQSVGVNTLIAPGSGSDMSVMRSKGMWVIPSLLTYGVLPSGRGSETVGYLIEDEPEFIYGPGSNGWTGAALPRNKTQCISSGSNCGFTVVSTQKSNLPTDGKPYALNFSPYMASPSFIPLTSGNRTSFANNYTNMFDSLDFYWYANNFFCPSNQGGAEALGLSFATALTNDQCHRSSNYGAVARDLQGLMSHLIPLWSFVESGCVGCGGSDVSITGNQLQGAVLNAIINEARGIEIFTPNLAGSCPGDTILNNCNGINTAISAVTSQIRALATVINTQSFSWSFNANINSMLKFGPDHKWYIFAMQAGFNDSGTYTFTLPSGFTTASTATVLNESRTVGISGGAFSDTFSNEYTYHIYQINP